MKTDIIHNTSCMEGLKELPDRSIHCCVTSPPYWGLRDYGTSDQLGLEETPQEYVENMVKLFRQVRRVLKDDGTLWLNLGDSYSSYKDQSSVQQTLAGKSRGEPIEGKAANRNGKILMQCGLKNKDLIGIPWMVAFALQADGWYLRQDIIWHKPNPMPESVTDRCTKSHEYIFLLTKSARYYYDADAIKEQQSDVSLARARRGVSDDNKWTNGAGGQTPHSMSQQRSNDKDRDVSETRNKRSVWTVTTKPYKEAHFAVYPEKLIEPCIKAGTSAHGCCADCGAPWRRITERLPTGYDGSKYGESAVDATGGVISGGTEKSTLGSSGGALTANYQTTGWQPTCQCECKKIVPAIVLDPFMGAGTTGLVARKLSRHYVGYELNAEYIKIAEKRIFNEIGLFL